MSNSFNISVKPEIAALDAKVVLVDAVVDAIRGTDVGNIQTNINANETKIDTAIAAIATVDGNVDLIKLITDALNSTGKFIEANSGVSDAFATILEVASGSGFLTGLHVYVTAAVSGYLFWKITIDGSVQWDGTQLFLQANDGGMSSGLSCIHRFNTSLKVEASASGTPAMTCSVSYIEE